MIDDLTDEEYSEEIDNGLIDIDLRFEMVTRTAAPYDS